MSDRPEDEVPLVVLNMYNGRPSLFIEWEMYRADDGALSGHHLLSWRAWGYSEPFNLWIQMPLNSEEANDLAANGPRFMDDYISERAGRLVRLVAYGAGGRDSLAGIGTVIPADAKGVVWMLAAMADELQVRAAALRASSIRSMEDLEDLETIDAALALV